MIFQTNNSKKSKAQASKGQPSNSQQDKRYVAEVEGLNITGLRIDDRRNRPQEQPGAREAPKSRAPVTTTREAPTQKAYQPPPPAYKAPRAPAESVFSRAATNPNWRAPDPREAQGFPAAYNPSPKYQGLDPNKVKVMTPEVCVVGDVFRAAVHEQDLSDVPGWTGPVDDNHTCATNAGAVYSKVRWMIVVAVYRTHYNAIPLYTHNKSGLENKPEEVKEEYASVHDSRVRRSGFENQSPDNPVLDASMFANTTILHGKTVAHLTAPLQRKFGLYVEEQGRLSKKSAQDLVNMYRSKL